MFVKATLSEPAGFGDFRQKKHLNARGFAHEYLRSCSLKRLGETLKTRGQSSRLHSKKIFFLGDAGWL